MNKNEEMKNRMLEFNSREPEGEERRLMHLVPALAAFHLNSPAGLEINIRNVK